MDEDLAFILRGLGHEAATVAQIGAKGTEDIALLEVAADYDIFVTLDLHRQEAEFVAVTEALIRGDVRILRIRLPKEEKDLRLDLTRSVIYRMDRWLSAFRTEDAALVTIRELGTVDSTRTKDEALAMIEAAGHS